MKKCSQCVNYRAACECNAQSRNESHLCQKRTKWWVELQENFACPTLASWGWFLRGGEGHLANRLGSWFGMNTKLLRGVIGPILIYTEWLSKYSIWYSSWPAWELQNNPSMGKVWFKNIWSCSKPKDTYCLKPLSQGKSLTCWWKQQQLVVVLFFNIWAEISH